MKRAIVLIALLLATGVGGALAYQAAARDRDYRVQLAKGDAALQDDQTFSAIEAYSGAATLRPDAMLAYLRRGEAYQRRGDLAAAAKDFVNASALDPTATRPLEELGDVLYLRQRYDRAAETYETYQRFDDRSARVSYKLALARYRGRALDSALAALDQTVKLNDRLPDAHYLRGLCLKEQGRTVDAQRAFERAVLLSPGLIAAREELADLYRTLGHRTDELEQLQLLAALDDREHIERQVAVGLAHARAGHPDLAVLTLGNALERTPDQPLIYGALGQVWLDIAQSRNDRVALGKALEALERVASSPGATSEALTLYGRALLRDGETDVAERALQQAIVRFPIEPTAFLFYATAAERQNHLEEARQALISYGALVSGDAEFVGRATRIATLSLRLDDVEAAVEWLQRASTVSPNDVKLLASLADAQIRAGDPDSARATIATAFEKDPKNPALAALARRAK